MGGGADDLSSDDESAGSSKFHPDDDSVGYSLGTEDEEMENTWKREGDDDLSSGSDSESECGQRRMKICLHLPACPS